MATLPGIELVELPSLDAEIPCVGLWEGDVCGRPQEWRWVGYCVRCGEPATARTCTVHREAFDQAKAAGYLWTSCCRELLPVGTWMRL